MLNYSIKAQSNIINTYGYQNSAEIASLQRNVELLAQQNQEKYFYILSAQPNYGVDLYQPKDKLKAEKIFKKQLLLKQLDRLMDQQNIFDKKIAQINFTKELESQQINRILEKELNSYRSLRSAWAKHQISCINTNGMDRLDSLNLTIGALKNTILTMKNKEQLYQQPFHSNHNLQNLKYEKLIRNYERSQMSNEQMRQQVQQLNLKLQKKQQNQKELLQLLTEKQKQIKNLKKIVQINDMNHKLLVSQLQQKILLIQKSLQRNQKWRRHLEKIQYQNHQEKFNIYIETIETSTLNYQNQNSKTTTKNLEQIENFLSLSLQIKHSASAIFNPEILNFSQNDQQNNEIIIPTLSLTQNSEPSYMRKKMNTQRPLKIKNFEFQKFVGTKLVNLKERRKNYDFRINDQTAKKFVRKSQILGTSRNRQPLYSERNPEIMSIDRV